MGKSEKTTTEEHFLIVGIGASAGGIQALKSFFAEVPKDSGIAYVVILHMSPAHESKLAEILQTISTIPVTQVRERTKVQPNQVYVVPPDQRLAIADGHLELKNIIGTEERRSPVDLFFRTLAETHEHHAVSVILSGTGTDGSMGLKRIKEHGGVAFVQDPDEAQYKDMPRNGIATGIISPYRTLEDRIEGIVVTLVGISAQTRAEDEVKVVYNELESRIERRTDELTRSNVALRTEIKDRTCSEEERHLLLDELVRAQEEERRRLARDLHDHLGQRLTTLRMRIESMKDSKARSPATPDELQEIVRRLDADVDFLAWELRPIALDELGLETALSNYAQQWSQHFNAQAEFHARGLGDERLPPDVESNLYRIAQEALNNCAKHAKCTQASIILERRDHHVILIIEDNGAGFAILKESKSADKMGLLSMRERASLINGTFDIESTPTKGTTVFVRVHLAGNPND